MRGRSHKPKHEGLCRRETLPRGEGSAAENEFVVAVKLEMVEDGDILTTASTLVVEEKEKGVNGKEEATASVTYSTFHGFYGRPVKLVSSLKSVLYSVLPLFVTLVVMNVLVGLIVLGFGVFVGLVYKGVQILGFEIEYESNYFLCFAVFVMVLAVSVLIYLTVEWSLAYVVVVLESKWGLQPLKRSACLIKGMRWVALAVMFSFGILIGLFAMASSSLVLNAGYIRGGRLSWAFVLQTVVCSGFMTVLMLYSVAAHTVLYMYCKALHGELAFDIAEEFAREYLSLPFDDGKVPHVVYVVPH
ncbi:unnamed protein product [Fraxinus pennsylvanica]|uniref:Uncharacterized protein n=1 Tax=Fraxinus pennsylvanica TaxID=56036 RepID=A0AAD1ZDW9_9LAMI|nr:unnamed protein product [Fraxinus pennsylvanica]